MRRSILSFSACALGISQAIAQTPSTRPSTVSHPQISSYFPREVFKERRQKLAAKIGSGIAMILSANEPEVYIPFRQNNTFFYFTGLEVPGALLWVDGGSGRSTLFLPDVPEFDNQGPRLGSNKEVIPLTGMDNVTGTKWLFYSLAYADGQKPIYTMTLPEELGEGSRDRSVSILNDRFQDPWDQRGSREQMFIKHLRQQFPTREVRDLTPIIDELRWVKDDQEIRAMRESAKIGVEGINEAIRASRPGVYEHELADVAHYVFMRRGARGDAYFPVVASGSNSNYTHYNLNRRKLEPGDLIVMDYAPEFQYEDSDITRTWPASGSFSAEQVKFYDVLLEAHRAIIAAVKPGVTPNDLRTIARAIYEKHGMGQYWPGGIGHFVGMSTHDPGPYDKPFVPGVIFNVEPMIDVKEKRWHFRLEDTLLVTSTGHEVLTAGSPWELADIYKLRDTGSTLDLKPVTPPVGADHAGHDVK